MSRKQKRGLARIGAGAVLLAAAWLLPLEGWASLAAFAVPYAVVGWDVLWKAVRNILHGQVFDENFLMALATVGAFATGEYSEGVAVMLFYQIGEWFQRYAVGRSRKSIAALMDIRPDHANLVGPDGTAQEVDPDEVSVGSIILVLCWTATACWTQRPSPVKACRATRRRGTPSSAAASTAAGFCACG